MELIEATRDNIDEVHGLWTEAADWMKARGINQWIPEQLTREAVEYCYENSRMFLAKSDGETVGTFFIVWSDPYIWGELDNSCSGYLHRLVVPRRYAGTGLGIELLRLAEQYIRNSGKTHFRLDCMADNEKLNAFYRNAGFAFKGRVDGDGWSASLYEKSLVEAATTA